MSVDWSYFDRYERSIDMYMPSRGEGDTMASQIVTAINKLIYKWYNDGDVYDNNYGMEGWANDLSSYANWLYQNVSSSRPILEQIKDCFNSNEYEAILKELADSYLDEEDLSNWNKKPKVGSIYDCDGPYSFSEYDEDEDDDYWGEDEEYDDEEEY